MQKSRLQKILGRQRCHVVQQVKLLFATPAPAGNILIQLLIDVCILEDSIGWPKYLGSCTQVGDQDGIPSSWLQHGPTPAVAGFLGNESADTNDLSPSPTPCSFSHLLLVPLSLFQTNKEVNVQKLLESKTKPVQSHHCPVEPSGVFPCWLSFSLCVGKCFPLRARQKQHLPCSCLTMVQCCHWSLKSMADQTPRNERGNVPVKLEV